MLSIAGSITVMNTQTAYARMGVDVNGNPAGNREIYQPTDDPVYYYQPPVDENGNHDYFGYPIYGDPQDITDEEFFGKWDVYTNRWTMEPYFSYDAYPGMELVQEAVKKGNYDAAKRELKEYYKTNAWKIGKKPSAVNSKGMDHLDALSRNIYAYSMISMTAIRGFNLPANEFGKVELNVLDEVDTAKALAFQEFNLMLASGDKFWTTGQYYSKDAADPSVRPVLRMIVNGLVTERVANKDAMVVAGTERKVNYGYDEIIEVQEHGYYDDCGDVRGTCDEDTKRSFVCFDISDIKSTDKITYAKVILTGRSVITDETRERFADEEGNPYSGEARDKLLWAIWYRASAWDEDTFTWASDFFTDKFYFSCNDENAWDYISSNNTNIKGKVCDFHRYYQQNRLTTSYAASGDERFAYTDIRQCMALINSIGFEPEVMNALDVSRYLNNLCYTILALIDSEYMSDEVFTALLKFAWTLNNWQVNDYFGVSSNNWATYATGAAYRLCAYFPEFATHDFWLRRIREEHDRLFGKYTLDDGHCVEMSQDYIATILGTFEDPLGIYTTTEHESPFGDGLNQVIYDIVKNGVYCAIGAPLWHGFNIADTGEIGTNRVGMFRTWYNYLFEGDEELLYIITNGRNGKMPENPTTRYPLTLRTYMRTSWDSKNSLAMSFINTSDSRQSHGHTDALSITLWAYGKYLLSDQGYGSDQIGDIPVYNASQVQHNVVTVNDNYDFLNDGVAARTSLAANTTWEKDFESNKFYDFIEYACDGFSTTKLSQRSVTFLKNQGFWIVSDYALPKDPNDQNLFAQHWHFAACGLPEHDEKLVLHSNFDDVNVMVVPIEYNEIDEVQYIDRLYSPKGGQKIVEPKAVYTKTRKGAGRFTTLLIPIKIDEEFEVISNAVENTNEIDDNLLHMAYFKVTKLNKNDETFRDDNYYYYYHIDDATQIPKDGVKFSNFVTDATTLVVQQNSKDEIVSVFVVDGSYVKMVDQDGVETGYLFSAEDKTTISYLRNGNFINVVGSEYEEASNLKGVQVYMQNIKAARLDGKDVEVEINGNVIEFSGEYGSNNISSGGGGGGGGGGATVKPPVVDDPEVDKPVDPEPPVDPKPVTPSYDDVREADWYFNFVEELSENGIVSGDGTGNFNPSANVTREQFLKMLVEATDIEAEEGENNFVDVKDSWYKPYVLKAKNFGIVNGISDTEFGIGSNITRQDMAVMITRTIEKLGIEIEKENVSEFADDEKVSDYAKVAVTFMKSIGLIEGYNNEYRPLDNLTRAEASKVICELLKLMVTE